MVTLLEAEPDIARAQFKGDQTWFWAEMAENLNPLGPPVRTPDIWRRVWFDYKCAVKKKLRVNKKSLTATGGGPCKQVPLNEVEERLANLTNLRATVAGNSARSFGMPSVVDQNNNNNEQTDLEPIPEEEQQVCVSPPVKRTKRKQTEAVLRQNQEMVELMKNHIEIQKKMLELQQETVIALREATEQLKIANNRMNNVE
ncbi:uncharacterized protein LOC131292937 [Anopheles ziemanni]|uniref:uncharacterized protein LOC131271291 n=1 Tax=Anopheles coustani TaxID=139045 RepID=UPI00265B4E8B|nr:uncharacterized protein LOC131271291 [Anopheles coustani]XP_058177017.1 uncharacterized protein LOC131292937 [Anopheles ziemanni]